MIDYNKDDFQKVLEIDKYKLDEECIKQSSLYFYYQNALIDAKSELTRVKGKYELAKSEAYLRIKQQHQDSDKNRITEATLSALVAIDEDVNLVKEEVANAESVYNNLQVAVSTLDSKRSELDNLVKLYCAGYYSVNTGNNADYANEIRKNLNNKSEETI